MSRYLKCSDEEYKLLDNVINEYHCELIDEDVRISMIKAFGKQDKEGQTVKDAIMLRGKSALAMVRKLSKSDQVTREFDVEITIDGDRWDSLSEKEQIAVLDHELEHIVIKRNKDGEPKYNENNNIILAMKHHDIDIGVFSKIIERHREDSIDYKHLEGPSNIYKRVKDGEESIFPNE